jgi:hypothetical protein
MAKEMVMVTAMAMAKEMVTATVMVTAMVTAMAKAGRVGLLKRRLHFVARPPRCLEHRGRQLYQSFHLEAADLSQL